MILHETIRATGTRLSALTVTRRFVKKSLVMLDVEGLLMQRLLLFLILINIRESALNEINPHVMKQLLQMISVYYELFRNQ